MITDKALRNLLRDAEREGWPIATVGRDVKALATEVIRLRKDNRRLRKRSCYSIVEKDLRAAGVKSVRLEWDRVEVSMGKVRGVVMDYFGLSLADVVPFAIDRHRRSIRANATADYDRSDLRAYTVADAAGLKRGP